MAPQQKPIDWEKLDAFLLAGCTQIRIAGAMGVSVDTIQRRVEEKYGVTYTDYATSKHCEGEAILEFKQYQKAVKQDNTQMQIWLGKTRLGQKETINNVNFVSSEEILKTISENKPVIE